MFRVSIPPPDKKPRRREQKETPGDYICNRIDAQVRDCASPTSNHHAHKKRHRKNGSAEYQLDGPIISGNASMGFQKCNFFPLSSWRRPGPQPQPHMGSQRIEQGQHQEVGQNCYEPADTPWFHRDPSDEGDSCHHQSKAHTDNENPGRKTK